MVPSSFILVLAVTIASTKPHDWDSGPGDNGDNNHTFDEEGIQGSSKIGRFPCQKS